MRCSCGALIKAAQRRCRKCAVEFARGIDTDYVPVQAARKEERPTVQPLDNPNRGGVRSRASIIVAQRKVRRSRQIKIIFSIAVVILLMGSLAMALFLLR